MKKLSYWLLLGILCFVWSGILIADEGDYVCDGKNLMQFVDGALEKAGTLAIADDFNKKDSEIWNYKKVNHCWEIKDKSLVTKSYGGSLPLKQSIKGGYVIQVKVKPIASDPSRKGGFTGISVGGVLFTLQSSRYWWMYKRPGDKRGVGGWKDEKVPFDRWYDFKIVVRAGGVFEWFVDGRKLCSLVEPEIKGEIRLHSWRIKTAYKEFKLYKIKEIEGKAAETGNINRVRNGSFEISYDNLAPYWRPQGYRGYNNMEDFFQNWVLDKNEKYEGEISLRMSGSKKNGVRSHFCSIPKGDCVLSMYMKSSVDNLPVTVFMIGVPKSRATFTVGKEWKRYELAFVNTKASRCRFYILPKTADTLWVDAVQLESGKVATAFKTNPLDTVKTTTTKKKKFPTARIARVTQSPVIDGKLDDAAWKSSAKSPDFRIPGNIPGTYKTPKEKTEAFLAYDDKALYIGVKCYDSNIDKLKATVKENRSAVAGDECIELFIDTNNDKQTFYRFVVNSLGYNFESKGSDDFSWSGDWNVKTYKGKDFWSIEIAIPLASFGITPAINDIWGMNICRSNGKASEYPCTAPVSKKGMYFHKVAEYSKYKWDDKEVFNQFQWTVQNLNLVTLKDNLLALTGEIVNQTSKDMKLAIIAEISGQTIKSKPFTIKKGSTKRVSIPGFKNADSKDILAQIKLIAVNSNQVLAQKTARVAKAALMQAVVERSYYTNESDAVIQVSIALPDKSIQGSSIVCELRNKDGKSLLDINHKVTKALERITIPLKKLPLGDLQVKIKLLDSGKKQLANASEIIRKLTPKPDEVKVDKIRRITLVNGKPFFPFAPLQIFHVPSGHPYRNYNEKIDARIKYWADLGFKSLMVGANLDKEKGQWGEKIWDQIFKSGNKYKIKIIVFWTGPSYKIFEDKVRLKRLINRWKNEPSLLAWVPEDEPEIKHVKPEDIAIAVKFIQKLDPYHLTYINYTQMGPASRYAGLPGQIMCLDYYLTSAEGRTIKDTLQYVDIMQEVSIPMHVPVWNFLAGSNLDNHPREPSAGEQVAQTYANVIKEVSGLLYFFGQVAGREHWKVFQELNKEIEELTPVLFSSETVAKIKSNNPSILVMTKKYQNKIYLVCVNIDDKEYDTVFDLSALQSVKKEKAGFWGSLVGGKTKINTDVMFEKRKLQVEDQLLKDTFKPFERHVYQLKIRKN